MTEGFLRTALREEVDATFNADLRRRRHLDQRLGLPAWPSGAAKNKPIDGGDKGTRSAQALHDVLDELSRQIVRDGEGATHVVTIEVAGAENAEAAERVARRIGASPLVKTAFFGADPNWGRILCADRQLRRRDRSAQDRRRHRRGRDRAAAASASAARPSGARTRSCAAASTPFACTSTAAAAQARHVTCDLTVDYVKLNADYRIVARVAVRRWLRRCARALPDAARSRARR